MESIFDDFNSNKKTKEKLHLCFQNNHKNTYSIPHNIVILNKLLLILFCNEKELYNVLFNIFVKIECNSYAIHKSTIINFILLNSIKKNISINKIDENKYEVLLFNFDLFMQTLNNPNVCHNPQSNIILTIYTKDIINSLEYYPICEGQCVKTKNLKYSCNSLFSSIINLYSFYLPCYSCTSYILIYYYPINIDVLDELLDFKYPLPKHITLRLGSNINHICDSYTTYTINKIKIYAFSVGDNINTNFSEYILNPTVNDAITIRSIDIELYDDTNIDDFNVYMTLINSEI